ncbi:MAG: 5'-nucleotidase C-terminal domain-containing protein [Acidimicrobiia bacterium]
MRSRRTLLIGVIAALVLALAAPAAARPGSLPGPADPGVTLAGSPDPGVALWLTILHNNDGESKLINRGVGLEDFGGAARFKTVTDNLKRQAVTGIPPTPGAKRAVIMVSSGDNFLAGPEFNVSLETGVPFYDTIALDLIGYDAIAIGNHDFDFNPDVLADFIEGFTFTRPPYLSSNLDYSGEPRLQALFDRGRIARSTVVTVRGERIGIIGATTEALPFISSPRNVKVGDVATAVNGEVVKLQRSGVNKIILISHLQSVQEDLALAGELTGVDVMVAGGGDEVLANPGDLLVPGDAIQGSYPLTAVDKLGTEIPVVTTAGNYSYVGKLVVGFDRRGDVVRVHGSSGPVRVAGGTCNDTLPCDDAVMPDPKMQSMVVDPLIAALEELATNVIAVSAVDLDGRRTSVRGMETNEGNLIADSLLWQATQLAASFGVQAPDVALQNGGGIRNDNIIPAGNLTELDTFAMVPFANFLSVVEGIPRAQFKELLENAYSRVEFGDGRFAQIAGFRVTYDASGVAQIVDADGNVTTAGTRVREVVLDDGTAIVTGGAVVAGDPITIATIDFLAKGGDQYPYRGAAFTTLGVTYQQALANYLKDGLGGVVSATDYPEGGEGRITRLD